ncbi:MAG: glutathione S-transferase N-terminal domain-containing protein, partial [Rhodanobacteraceae bacterium]
MELLYTPNSPYSRIVRVRVLEQALDVKFTRVSLRESADQILEHNPAGKVPALILDDGRALSETRLVCEYLDSR